MGKIRQPADAKNRADHIGDLMSAACEELLAFSKEWFELNDPAFLENMHRKLGTREIRLMVSVHQEDSGLAHIALNLLRADQPMPPPFFVVRVPMLQSTLR